MTDDQGFDGRPLSGGGRGNSRGNNGGGRGYGSRGNGGRPYGGNPYSPGLRPYAPPAMRTSAADRDRAIEVLKAAYGEGRLTKEELDARIERAMSTGTYADLSQVVRDLPGAGQFGPPPPSYPQPRYSGTVQASVNGLAVGSLICSLLGFIPLAPAAASIVMGHAAHAQIRQRGQRGYGVATAGLVIGYLGLLAWILIIVTGVALTTAHTGPVGPPGGG